MANVKVNAVGDQCPIPVVKATKALGEFKEAGTLEVQVDNEIAIQNLTRLADSKGLKSRSEKLGENLFAITMEVNGPLLPVSPGQWAARIFPAIPTTRETSWLQ